MTINIEKMHAGLRRETRELLVSFVLATAAAVGAGVGIANLTRAHREPQPQQPMFTPGTVVTIQPARP